MPTFISVVRDFDMYEKFMRSNTNCAEASFIAFDNRGNNVAIPVRYNSFLDSYNYSNESWFVFCHEDFEFLENLVPILCQLNKERLYGVVGGRRVGFAGFGMQVVYGNMSERNRNGGDEEWLPGRKIKSSVKVEALDCCCLMVHSSLVNKYNLRFDESLSYDFYVEDFCAMAKIGYGICSYVYPINSCHHSGSKPSDRYFRHLPYLAKKYPNNCFIGTISYFGTPRWQKRFQDVVWSLVKRVFMVRHKL